MTTITERFHAAAIRVLDKTIPTPNAKWIQSDNPSVPDPNKPWQVEHGATSEHDVRILFYPPDTQNAELIMYLRGTAIPTGVIFGIMYRYDAFTPDLNDTVIWNGNHLNIANIDPIQPVDNAIVYIIEFKD